MIARSGACSRNRASALVNESASNTTRLRARKNAAVAVRPGSSPSTMRIEFPPADTYQQSTQPRETRQRHAPRVDDARPARRCEVGRHAPHVRAPRPRWLGDSLGRAPEDVACRRKIRDRLSASRSESAPGRDRDSISDYVASHDNSHSRAVRTRHSAHGLAPAVHAPRVATRHRRTQARRALEASVRAQRRCACSPGRDGVSRVPGCAALRARASPGDRARRDMLRATRILVVEKSCSSLERPRTHTQRKTRLVRNSDDESTLPDGASSSRGATR